MFKRFENGDFNISDKNVSEALQLWKRTNCKKMGKSCGKRWKIFRLIYIWI